MSFERPWRSLWAVAVLALLCSSAAAQPAAASLTGDTIDFDYDAADVGHPERAYRGRIYLHPAVRSASPERARPLLIFIHGTNAAGIVFRWMGGGHEGDVRHIVAALMDQGRIEPVVLAAPSAVRRATIAVARTAWPAFDLDRFVAATVRQLRGRVPIDLGRILVAAHSGGGCNPHGGLATAMRAAVPPRAVLSIDTCMEPSLARQLAAAPATMDVVVSWQTQSWTSRPLRAFIRAFRTTLARHPLAPTVLRVLDHRRIVDRPMPHDAMVPLTLERWLPRLLPPRRAGQSTADKASSLLLQGPNSAAASTRERSVIGVTMRTMGYPLAPLGSLASPKCSRLSTLLDLVQPAAAATHLALHCVGGTWLESLPLESELAAGPPSRCRSSALAAIVAPSMHRTAVVLGALGGLLVPPVALWACSRAQPGPAICSAQMGCRRGEACVLSRCRPAASAPVALGARRLVYSPEDIAWWDGAQMHAAAELPDALVLGRQGRHERLLVRFALPRRPPGGRLQRALLRLDPLPRCPLQPGRIGLELASILTPWRSSELSRGRQPRLDLPWRLADVGATPPAPLRIDVTELVSRWRQDRAPTFGVALLAAGGSDTGACFTSGVSFGRGPRLVLYFVDRTHRDGGADSGVDGSPEAGADATADHAPEASDD